MGVLWQQLRFCMLYLLCTSIPATVAAPQQTSTDHGLVDFDFPCSTTPPSGKLDLDILQRFNVTSDEKLLGLLAQSWLAHQGNSGRALGDSSPLSLEMDKNMNDLRQRILKSIRTHLNVTQLIEKQGYPVEHHSVHTEDGFILGVQRIPYGKKGKPKENCPKPVVILQHGLFGSASNFVSNLANESLGYVLADAGYDVWLGNSRGNTYSRKHETLKPYQKAFWYWSWDEMGKYDLPALVSYVLKHTNQERLFYVGHSQGTTIAFAELSRKDSTLTDKIKLFVALAPVAKVSHISGLFRRIADNSFCCFAKDVLATVHQYELLGNSYLVNTLLADTVCSHPATVDLCVFVFEQFGGINESNLNKTRMPDYVYNSPAGTSIYDVEHFCQMVLSDQFQMYNYGREENLRRYGQPVPPMYHPKNIEVPVAFFSGGQDRLADMTDVKWIRSQLGSNLVFDKFMPTYGHVDFILGLDAVDVIYHDIVDLFHKFA